MSMKLHGEREREKMRTLYPKRCAVRFFTGFHGIFTNSCKLPRANIGFLMNKSRNSKIYPKGQAVKRPKVRQTTNPRTNSAVHRFTPNMQPGSGDLCGDRVELAPRSRLRPREPFVNNQDQPALPLSRLAVIASRLGVGEPRSRG